MGIKTVGLECEMFMFTDKSCQIKQIIMKIIAGITV